MSASIKVTIKDVAKAAGVSIGTVDRALNNRGRISESTKQKVMKAVQELDYHRNEFASAIRKSSKTKILVVNARNPCSYMDIFTKAFKEQAAEYEGYGMELEFAFADSLGTKDMCRAVASIKIENYDGILLNASGSELVDFIERAHMAGVPVGTFNSDIPGAQRVFFSGENHFSAGRLCGELIAKLLRGQGKTALFIGDETVFAQSERIRGFRDILMKDYPEIEISKILSHGDDWTTAEKCVRQLFDMEKMPDVVFCNSAVGGVPVCRYLKEMEKERRPLVVAYDDGKELVQLLKDGICTAIIYQEPTRQAKKALSYMFDALYYQKEWPEMKESRIMPSVVLKENSDIYFEHILK